LEGEYLTKAHGGDAKSWAGIGGSGQRREYAERDDGSTSIPGAGFDGGDTQAPDLDEVRPNFSARPQRGSF
jgi:hypothetical protein